MKKYGKLLSFAFLTFFISISSAFAKELTLSEFEKEVEKVQKDSGYVYIIGNYAFTSLHTLTTEDVMLAARSISLEDTDGYTNTEKAYEKMTMHMLQRTYDDDFNPTGWQKKDNVLGKTKLDDKTKLNIRYIDYTFIPEVSKATISVDVDSKEDYKKVLKDYLHFETENHYGKNSSGENAITYTDGKVSGLLLKKNDISLSETDKEKYKGADYFFAYILEVPEANENTKITLKGLDGETKEVTYKEFDVKATENNSSEKTPGIVILAPVDHTKFQNSTSKTITITVDVDGVGKEYEATTYTLDLSGLTFQQDSNATINLNKADENDTKILKSWGYNASKNESLAFNNGKLTGMLVPQTLNDEAFGKEKKFGYYFDFTFELPNGTDKNKVKISHLSDNDIKHISKTFNSDEYDSNSNLTILHQFETSENKCDNNDCKLYFSVDLDGDEENYLPTIYTIDYSDLKFAQQRKITYKYKDKNGNVTSEEEQAYEKTEIGKDITDKNIDYRTFDGWYDSEGQKVEIVPLFEEEGEDTGIELTAHWKINADEFISEVVDDLNSEETTYSDNFEGKIDLKQDETNKNEITINVEKPNISLTELAETSIPGSIAYILDKDEIKDITLTVGNQNVSFNKNYTATTEKTYEDNSERNLLTDNAKSLKTEIVKGAKDAFDKELSGKEADATLDQVEYNEKTFALTIGNTDDTVTLVDSEGNEVTDTAKKTYTFKFDSDFVVVDADNELGATNLKEALDKDYTKVYLNSDVEVTAPIDIEKENSELFIEPLETSSSPVVAAVNSILEKEVSEISNDKESKTISVTDGDYVIDVKSGNVTLKDVKISGATKAELKVEEGANVTVENVDVSGINETPKTTDEEVKAAIIVNGKLTANNVKNENESYALPTIAAVASDSSTTTSESKVTVSGMTKNNKYNLVDRTTNTKFHSVKSYNGEFYYNDENNSKIYFASVMDTVQGVRPSPYQAFQIYYYDEQIDFSTFGYVSGSMPEKDGKMFKEFKLGSSNGTVINNNSKVQDVFGANSEILLYAIYDSPAPTE